jgi:hypothetical protein
MGYILYEGPSVMDNKTIVALMTGVDTPSHNKKTGALAQVWIMRADISPTEAVKTKGDASICGNCIHRGKSCYVALHQAPLSIFRAYKAGRYTPIDPQIAGYRRDIRLGAYGDPAAVPIDIWERLLSKSRTHVGYTHSPRVSPKLKSILMASADTVGEALQYQAEGWKTFRVKHPGEPLLEGEINCLASTKGLTCQQCGVCDGKKANVAINIHGLQYKITNYNKWRPQNE